MSIEQNIETIAQGIQAINQKLDALMTQGATGPAAPPPAPEAAPSPAPQAPAAASPAPQAPAAPAPVTTGGVDPYAAPAAPGTQAPAADPAAVPFTDHNGMIDYVMKAYNALGQDKGAQIQTVMTNMGLSNINDCKPEQYATLYQGIQELLNGS